MDRHDFAAAEKVVSARSSEWLGFPSGTRVLIINCDDFGMYEAVNTGVVAAIETGVASSCSLMAPCPAAPQAMELLRRRPEIDFGIHLTLFCDTTHHRWGPLSAKEKVPSLLTEAGELFTPADVAALLAVARLQDIELEFRAQIAAVVDAGLMPTHLDWHCLADGGRDDIFELTTALAAEYGLAMRVWLEPNRHRARQHGLPVVDHDFLDSFRLNLDGKAARYAQLLRGLPDGLSEWAVHPGLGDEEAQAIDPGWRVRRTDYEFLISAQARQLLEQENIILSDYRLLQRRWSQIPLPMHDLQKTNVS